MSDPKIFSPLPDLERLVRITSIGCRLETSLVAYAYLLSEVPSQFDPSQSTPISSELSYLPPKVLELLSKGVDLQTTLLFRQLEAFELPYSHSEIFDIEEDPKLSLSVFKTLDFKSCFVHTYPSTSTKSEEDASIYTNPLDFEDPQKVLPKV